METIPEKRLPVLTRCPMFRGMTPPEIQNVIVLLHGRTEDFRRGELLHRPWEPMERFGLVLNGIVHACADDIEGNRMIMAEVVPGATFGESLAYLRVPDSPVYITVAEDASVLWLDPAPFRELPMPEDVISLFTRFTAMLAARTLTMNSRIQVLSRIRLRDKLVTYFTSLSHAAGSNTFMIPMNRNDLAVYMGANRSALSRELSLMKEEGLIDYHKNTVKILRNTGDSRLSH